MRIESELLDINNDTDNLKNVDIKRKEGKYPSLSIVKQMNQVIIKFK